MPLFDHAEVLGDAPLDASQFCFGKYGTDPCRRAPLKYVTVIHVDGLVGGTTSMCPACIAELEALPEWRIVAWELIAQ